MKRFYHTQFEEYEPEALEITKSCFQTLSYKGYWIHIAQGTDKEYIGVQAPDLSTFLRAGKITTLRGAKSAISHHLRRPK